MRIAPETAKKIRDLIKGGFPHPKIAVECGVTTPTVDRQAAILVALGKIRKVSKAEKQYGVEHSEAGRNGLKSCATQGKDADLDRLDLCDIFETPRTPRQIARAFRGQDQ